MRRYYIAWLSVVLFSTLSIFNINLNSDSLFAENLFNDLFHQGGSWFDWRFTPAPDFFPALFSYLISYFALNTVPERIVMVCVIQAICLAASVLYLMKSIKPNISITVQSFALSMIALISLVFFNSNAWVYYNSTNNHLSALIFGLLSVAELIKINFSPSSKNYCLLFIFNVLGAISTKIFIIAFFIPTIISQIFVYIRTTEDKNRKRIVLKTVTTLFLAQALVKVLDFLLLPFDAMKVRINPNLGSMKASIIHVAQATYHNFQLNNSYSFLFSCVVVISAGYLLTISSFKNTRKDPLSYCKMLLLFIFPLNIIGSVISGGFVDDNGYRYYALPIAMILIVTLMHLDLIQALKTPYFKKMINTLILMLPLLFLLDFIKKCQELHPQTLSSLIHNGLSGSKLSASVCLDDLEKHGVDLKSGVGDYWASRATNYDLKGKHYIMPVLNDGEYFFWMSTLNEPLKHLDDKYNFVVVSLPESHSSFFNAATFKNVFPAPEKKYVCDDLAHEIWFYQNNLLTNQVKFVIENTLFSYKNSPNLNYTIMAVSLPAQMGKELGNSREVDSGPTNTIFTYGPYITLKKGRYLLTLAYSANTNGNKLEVGRFNDPIKNHMIAMAPLPKAENSKIDLELNLIKNESQLEFRTWYQGAGKFIIKKIQIKKL